MAYLKWYHFPHFLSGKGTRSPRSQVGEGLVWEVGEVEDKKGRRTERDDGRTMFPAKQ